MEEKLISILDEVVAAIKAGVGQLPALAEQCLRYWLIERIIMVVVFLGLALVLRSFGKFAYRRGKETDDIETGTWISFLLHGCALGSIGMALYSGLQAVKILVAPQLYLIETLMRMVKQ